VKLVFFPRDIDGSGCYRTIFPMAYLGTAGHECFMPTFRLIHPQTNEYVQPFQTGGMLDRVPPGAWLLEFAENSWPADAEAYIFQGGSHSWQLEWARRAKQEGKRVIVDVDDDFHRIPKYNPARLDRAENPTINRKNLVELLKLADWATFSTQALHDFYSRWCEGTIIPNYLHWPMWEQLAPVYDRREWRKFRVGYMGNVDYHEADLKVIAPSFAKWIAKQRNVEVVAAGDPRIHDILGVPEEQRVSTSLAWFRMLDLPYITSCFDLGLVPLVRNDFNEGKSNLKGLEYAACGIPCLASPTAEYQRWVEEGENGYLCKHPKDFIERLEALSGDLAHVQEMGRVAHGMAREASLDKQVHQWEAALGISGGNHSEPALAELAA
jgi:glycosyltransferase involved in cell wall biosynthesis